MLFDFKRLQFPIRLAFSTTINKAQDQSLRVCGLGLVKSRKSMLFTWTNLFVFAKDGKNQKYDVMNNMKM